MSTLVWADIERDVVIVQGDDAGAFLHSQLANDIASLAVGSSVHSLLLEPTGQVTALVRVTRHVDTVYTLDVDAGFGESLITRLQRFVLRSKVAMRMSDWKVRAFRGPDAVATVGAGVGRAVPYRGGDTAIDVIAEASQLPVFGEETEAPHIDMFRVDAEWPRLGVDILVGGYSCDDRCRPGSGQLFKGLLPRPRVSGAHGLARSKCPRLGPSNSTRRRWRGLPCTKRWQRRRNSDLHRFYSCASSSGSWLQF